MTHNIELNKNDNVLVKVYDEQLLIKTNKDYIFIVDDEFESNKKINNEITLDENDTLKISSCNPVVITIQCVNHKLVFNDTFYKED